MHADLSRLTFRPDRHYSAVIAQQGRVQLDADANEQTAIQLHQARTLAADLIGQHGGPRGAAGFESSTWAAGATSTPCPSTAAATTSTASCWTRTARARRPGRGRRHTDEDGDKDGPDGEPAAPPPPGPTGTSPTASATRRSPATGCPRRPVAVPRLPEGVGALGDGRRGPGAARGRARRGDARHRGPGEGRLAGAAAVRLAAGRRGRGRPRRWSAPPSTQWAPTQAPDRPARRPQRTARPRRRGPLPGQAGRPLPGPGEPAVPRGDPRGRRGQGRHLQVVPRERLGGLPGRRTRRHLGGVGVPRHDDKLDLDVGDCVEFTDTAYPRRLEPLPLLRVEELDLPGRRVRLSGRAGTGRRAAAPI